MQEIIGQYPVILDLLTKNLKIYILLVLWIEFLKRSY